MREIEIGVNQCGQRLDKFLHKYMKEAPTSFLYKMLRKKNIKLNGKKADGKEKLVEGDVVTLYFSEETLEKFCGKQPPFAITDKCTSHVSLDVVYEDSHVVCINKPAGMLSQKAKESDVSLVEHFVAYAGSAEIGFTPGICNRLDRNTSGLVIGGKTLLGLQKMSELIHDRNVRKYYLAIVHGEMKSRGIVEGYLTKDEATNTVSVEPKERPGSSYIKTGYEALASDGNYTLVKVQLFTGKTHQIRSHLASISHPIVGDVKYGGKRTKAIRRQLLHAYELHFPELEAPFEGLSNGRVIAPVPKDFYGEEAIRRLMEHLESLRK
nr:RluA family pseudouridine synthase [Eubacterium sp.]